MKTIKHTAYALALALLFNACDQEVINLDEPTCEQDPSKCPDACASADPGTADFSKFIAIGNSLVAGVQGGALYTESQNNSLPAIINKQLECVGAPSTFNQPTINASLGWNLFVTQPFLTNPAAPILGTLKLQYGDPGCSNPSAPSVAPAPQAYAPGNLEALPNPQFNPGFLYTGSKTALNNFGVPAVLLGQSLIVETGKWSGAGSDPRFNPFYGRLAYPGGTSTMIGDAAAAGGTFFLFWLGLDDFFLHAAFGGDPTKAPLTPASAGGGPTGFDFQYAAAIGSLLASNAELKGVVGNFPDIFKMPHFTSVSYNPIPLDQTTVTQLTNGFAGYNAVLDALVANKQAFGISDALATEIASRKVSFEVSCNNKILMKDEALTDLGPYFDALKSAGQISDAQRAQLAPYQQVRHTTPTDVIPLSTGSVLGTNGTFGILGVSEPVGDQYVINPKEKSDINDARLAYNTIISNVVNANSARLALADINAGFDAMGAGIVKNGVFLTPNINPPTGMFSEDGVHPNSRGYAYLAGIFIEAINAKFGSTIPTPNLGLYEATDLPITP